ncbi:F-box only protein 39-like isoform X1 [Biomphalaria glabrata]|uniref:F-box only protein 39-like isoform X1 n=2 Tax=Biomphalaria glabrata TaxID=6526 RepID=A0A9W3BMU7_BIOGL|nr:F-box only protein 39-like isoform X1 [Biomphalaria glabrata]
MSFILNELLAVGVVIGDVVKGRRPPSSDTEDDPPEKVAKVMDSPSTSESYKTCDSSLGESRCRSSQVSGGLVKGRRPHQSHSDDGLPIKIARLELNDTTSNALCENSDENNEIVEHDWRLLPYPALKRIYALLPNKDRYNMAVACPLWSEPLTSGDIWRKLNFRFNRVEDWKAKRFTQKVLPVAVRYLNIDCKVDAGAVLVHKEWDSLVYLVRLLRYLLNHKVNKLVSLRVANMSRLTMRWLTCGKRKDLIMTLRGLLDCQTNLKVLNLSCAGLDLEQGTMMLVKAANNCGSRIKKLIIDGLFADNLGTDVLPMVLLEPITYFTKLKALSISSLYICDDVVEVIAGIATLKHLRIYTDEGCEEEHVSTQSWEILKDACPQLEVHYILTNVHNYYKFRQILKRNIPLTRLDWKVDRSTRFDFWVEEDVLVCLSYISETFKNTIRHIDIALRYSSEKFAPLFDDIIRRCLKLQTLSVKAPDDENQTLEKALTQFVFWASIRQTKCAIRELKFNGKNIHLERSSLNSTVKWLFGRFM